MNKLYPPLLEKTVPAFFGSTLNIDFQLNKAVTLDQVDEMKLIIKSTSTNQEKLNIKSTNIYLLNDQIYRVVFDNIYGLLS